MHLELVPAIEHPELLAPVVFEAIKELGLGDVEVAQIDPSLADTASFCTHYEVALEESANCVVIAGSRSEAIRMSACVALAHTRVDVNRIVRNLLGARKASFASMDSAVDQSRMEYGGITPNGLPAEWPIYIDSRVVDAGDVIVGSGIRGSKILIAGRTLAQLPGAQVIDGLAN